MSDVPVITIDGPSGSGKGTIAQKLCHALDWHFLDSGALYRVLAHAAKERGVSFEDEESLVAMATYLNVEFKGDEAAGESQVYLDGENITLDVRSDDAGQAASRIAPIAAVRRALLSRQRAFKQPPGLVADGRDMGTTVFPEASVKFFLTASAQTRAERRYKQLKEKGLNVSLSALLESIRERDDRDRNRSVAPLVPAEDAIVIDSSDLTIDEVVAKVRQDVKQKLGI